MKHSAPTQGQKDKATIFNWARRRAAKGKLADWNAIDISEPAVSAAYDRLKADAVNDPFPINWLSGAFYALNSQPGFEPTAV